MFIKLTTEHQSASQPVSPNTPPRLKCFNPSIRHPVTDGVLACPGPPHHLLFHQLPTPRLHSRSSVVKRSEPPNIRHRATQCRSYPISDTKLPSVGATLYRSYFVTEYKVSEPGEVATLTGGMLLPAASSRGCL